MSHMQTKELASARTRTYPSDHKKLTLMAKKRGGKVIPADIVRELLNKKKPDAA